MSVPPLKRRLPIGAEVTPEGVHFRVWAPVAQTLEVVLEEQSLSPTKTPHSFPLIPEEKGYFSGLVSEASDGTRYRFRVNGEDFLYPDPASRYQPNGPHGPSQVVDPSKFAWNDQHWKGVSLEGRVIYEMHIGTFTQQGTWSSATRELLELADLGITIIELMPVNEFPGQFGAMMGSIYLLQHVYMANLTICAILSIMPMRLASLSS